MAYEFTKQADGVGIPFNYTRGNPIPLDSWSLFMSLEAAKTYAKSNPVSYPGQVITVITNGSPVVYAIAGGHIKDGEEDVSTRTLVQLGTKEEINAATASAVINWLGADGNALEE